MDLWLEMLVGVKSKMKGLEEKCIREENIIDLLGDGF